MDRRDVVILAVETSCDETSAAVVVNGRKILSNIISSQVNLHEKYGGVVPEIASRKHVELVIPVIDQALEKASLKINEVDAIGVTYGPGLAGALLVGLSAAKGLAFALGKPLIGVNHIEGHIAANYLENDTIRPPFVCLVASGGHSEIVHVADYDRFEVMGRTRDDAAGEAFDKIARALGLGYPGGPIIDAEAAKGDSSAVDFPRVYFNDGSLDFSFSGPKTAVLNYLNGMAQKNENVHIPDICASFQQAVVDVLVNNTIRAALMKNTKRIALAGGVAANSRLRRDMKAAAEQNGIDVFIPAPALCTDNAAMIGSAAYYRYIKGHVSGLDLNAIPGVKIGNKGCG
ncbi:MAG: tRNA (adenosine(37)-N6)-threonylcarbamoyltransferase complex transferase subunit TsaD [Bacillota bacterium]